MWLQTWEHHKRNPALVPKPPEVEFTIMLQPDESGAYRAFIPSASTINSWVVCGDAGQQEWQESWLAQVLDELGIYKVDHGFRNGRKMVLPDGTTSNFAILTVTTSLGHVALQVLANSTGFDEAAPSFQALKQRSRELGLPVSPACQE